VGWGIGEDEEAGAILRVSTRPWGFFIFGSLKQIFRGVLALRPACGVPATAHLSWSRAAGWRRNLFERAPFKMWVVVLCAVLWLLSGLTSADESGVSMKRRQQGILTGMPFMANITPRTFVDDAGRKLYIAKVPARVISLAPSITEMLFSLGLDEQIVGVTDFCDYPPAAKAKMKVGYSNPNVETIVSLRPDLVLAPREFFRTDLQAKLEQLKIPVFVLEAKTLDDVSLHVQTLGRIVDRSTEANAVADAIRKRMAEIQRKTEAASPKRVLYVLNSQPLITVGPGSFIHQMIEIAGGINVATQAAVPYPRLSMETVLKEDPEVLVFPVGDVESVPRSEQQQWQRWTSLSAVKHHRFHEVSSNLLNRPGPRIVEGLEQLARAIHPELFGSVPQ
jgi:iron complex transport system substrate-binding protein